MENFIFGVQALGLSIRMTVIALINHPLMWGFGFGFLTSTIIHLFITTDVPRAIPLMMTRGVAESFQKIAPRDEKGAYELSYTAFQKEHSRVRIAFYSAFLAFLVVIGITLLRS